MHVAHMFVAHTNIKSHCSRPWFSEHLLALLALIDQRISGSCHSDTALLRDRRMLSLAAIACLSALLALVSCQTPAPADSSILQTCGQYCVQGCDIMNQVLSVFSVFLGPLAPFVSTGHAVCTQGCGVICGFFG
ncbi:hypothetical protein PoB_002980900 [Plakobranchus ocellatus]|uniref:Saposin B-type domain-containing protein n=1 Tax=Plakobranchus ocellatus TaxID=259542 RepID=A0AAV4A6I0_9GAST|nr:hypothetical protein PoB_002980900 [Plakobranchus ocellatus]